ncbi:IS66 family transposase [bacterium]|nr:IS66 family transposase [bacterium]
MTKDSIRKQIEKAKNDAKALLSSKKTNKETAIVINSLILIIDIIVTVFLVKKVRKTSSNSGVPSSQNFGSNGNRNKPGDSETDKKGSQLPNTKNVTENILITVDKCKECGVDLSSEKTDDTETREKIDIIYEITKKVVTVEIKGCDNCGEITKGDFPQGMDGKLQYGIGIKSAIINYIMVQMFSYDRCAEHFKGLIGRFISQATMLKYIMTFHLSLVKWEAKKIKELLKMPVIHVDETSIRINKVNHWIHVYTYGNISLQFVHRQRGIDAVDDIGIIPKYGGIIVHDCWATYFSYKNVGHALCGSHILRELRYIMECEKDGASWAMMMKDLLKEAGKVVGARSGIQILYTKEYKMLQTRYRKILNYALTELPAFPTTGKNGKGKPKHTDAQNLYLRLKKYESSILMFARIKEVNFTNNRAERDIRCSKTKQKVSGGFRTLKYAKAYARITSFVKTMRYNGYSSFEAINLAMAGKKLK